MVGFFSSLVPTRVVALAESRKGAAMELSGAAIVRKTTGHHGEVRGLSLSRRSSQFEGRFGRMFRTLPPAKFDEDMLKDLARAMTADPDAPGTTPQEDQQREIDGDDEENP